MKKLLLILFAGAISVNFLSCKKNNTTPPVVSTKGVSQVSYSSAVSGGSISNSGGLEVSSCGVCIGQDPDPDIKNTTFTGTLTAKSFNVNLNQLMPNTKYFARAFASNEAGTGFGEELSFTTSQSTLPVLITSPVISIRKTTAISGRSITDDGGSDIIAHGLCRSTTQNPTTNDNRTNDGRGIGLFTSKISGLTESTTYYLRAYDTNLAGTAYGSEVTFRSFGGPVFNPGLSYGTVPDIDGNVYKTITINGREWMAENLKVSKYNDGTLNFNGTILMHIKDPGYWNMATPAFCWYNNDSTNFDIYGTLYNWYAVSSGKLCPSGWHIPSL